MFLCRFDRRGRSWVCLCFGRRTGWVSPYPHARKPTPPSPLTPRNACAATQGYEPDAACCVRAADAACASGDRASAIKYCAEAEARGLAASEGAVAFAEGRSSGLEDAYEVAGSDGKDTSDSSSPSVEGVILRGPWVTICCLDFL